MPKNTLSRRDFLKVAGITVAATTITCSGVGYIASRPPEIATPDIHLEKDNTMNKRILITYATRAGSTAEIAAAIGDTLHSGGFGVDVIPVKDSPSLAAYDAVIIGSAIRMGSWLPEAVEFIKTNQTELNVLPVALFTVHMMNTGEDQASRTARLSYLDSVRSLFDKAVEEVYFEGKMDFSKLSFLDRTISRMVKSKEADFRNWDKIHAWAETIPTFLALPAG